MASTIKTAAAHQASPRPRAAHGLYSILIGLMLLVPLIGGIYYAVRSPQVHQDANDSLTAIARLNAGQVDSWLDEREADLHVVASRGDLQPDTLQTGTQAAASRLAAFRAAYQYKSAAVVDARGRVFIQDGAPLVVADDLRRLIASGTRAGKVLRSDISIDGDGEAVIYFLAPMRDLASGESGEEASKKLDEPESSHFIIASASLERSVLPYFRDWPSVSRTGAACARSRFLSTPP